MYIYETLFNTCHNAPSRHTSDIQQIQTYIIRNFKLLNSTLSSQQTVLLEKLCANYDELLYLSTLESFEQGIKTALSLITT